MDPWQPVTDPKTGGVYWHNTHTNQTTAVGEAKPTTMELPSAAPQQQPPPLLANLLHCHTQHHCMPNHCAMLALAMPYHLFKNQI